MCQRNRPSWLAKRNAFSCSLALWRRAERLVVVPKFFQHALSLFEQPLLEVRDLLLDHRLELLVAFRCLRHRQLSLVSAM